MNLALRCAVAALLCLPIAARADRPAAPLDARVRFERGLRLYSARSYDQAVVEFQACFDLDPQRECLFAWAQAERLSGDCSSAIVLYRRYLDTRPPQRAGETARHHLDACERALSTRPPRDANGAAATESAVVDPAKAPAENTIARAPSPRRPWYKDPAGGALVGVGVAGLALGGVLYPLSASAATQDAGQRYEDFSQQLDLARRERVAAWVGFGIGAGALTAGILRYAILGTRR